MIRASTPVTVFLVIAFGLLLVATLTTPIIKSIALGSVDGTTFGVFGYCKDAACSGVQVGYDASSIKSQSSFSSSQSIRSAVSALLIIHPVAALTSLIYAILAIISHLHSPSHSSRFLIIMFVYGFVSTLVCLLAFLTDIILFNPFLAVGSWLVLAATILSFISALFSIFIWKSLAGRKARQQDIQKNAEMSGENFYNRQRNLTAPSETQPTVPSARTAGPGAAMTASFEKETSEDSIPLTQRSPTERSTNAGALELRSPEAAYSGPVGPRRVPMRDPYGNPMNGGPQGMPPPPMNDAYGMRRPSQESTRSRGRGMGPGMGPGPLPAGYRGRGGYGPPRGGPMNMNRGGYGRGGGPGGYYGPPRGGYPYGNRGGYGGPMMRGGRSPQPPQQPPAYWGDRYDAFQPAGNRDSDLPRAESPPPLPGDMAEDMGAEQQDQHLPQQFRDSDADIVGMIGLQQGRATPSRPHDTMMSGSHYSQPDEQYVSSSPRPAWDQTPGRNSPVSSTRQHPSALPAPLQTGGSTSPSPQPHQEVSYVEDIDPRFIDPPAAVGSPPPAAYHPADLAYANMSPPERESSPALTDYSRFTSISQRPPNRHYSNGSESAAPYARP